MPRGLFLPVRIRFSAFSDGVVDDAACAVPAVAEVAVAEVAVVAEVAAVSLLSASLPRGKRSNMTRRASEGVTCKVHTYAF